MIEVVQFVEVVCECGFDWYVGVFCLYLMLFINYVLQDLMLYYVLVVNEGDVVVLIVGVMFGGKCGIVMMQNLGFGNVVSLFMLLIWMFCLL